MTGTDLIDIFDLPLLPWSPPWVYLAMAVGLLGVAGFFSRRRGTTPVVTYPGAELELRQLCSLPAQSISPDRLSRMTRRVLEQRLNEPVTSMASSELRALFERNVAGNYRALIEALLALENARYLSPETVHSAVESLQGVVLGSHHA